MNNFENIWYLPAENTWKEMNYMAMKDIGTLSVYPDGLLFKGTSFTVPIKTLISISYGKQGRDFVNNWVRIDYFDAKGEAKQAFFADGNNRGWSGIFGGTKKIYTLLKSIYE